MNFVAVAFILIQNNSVVMIAFLNGVKYDLTLLIFVILIVMIAIALWPITLTLIGLFLLWLFLPEKKLACYNNEMDHIQALVYVIKNFVLKKVGLNTEKHVKQEGECLRI